MRHGIGGSIGVDFPSVQGKGPRQAVAAAIDAALEPPFERTALNGFGFLQLVRPRVGVGAEGFRCDVRPEHPHRH